LRYLTTLQTTQLDSDV